MINHNYLCTIENNKLIIPITKETEQKHICYNHTNIIYYTLAYDVALCITYEKCAGKNISKVILNINLPLHNLYRLCLNDIIVGVSRVRHGNNLRFLPCPNDQNWNHLKQLQRDKYIDIY